MTQPVPPRQDRTPTVLPGEFTLEQVHPARIVVVNRWLTAVALTIGIILMLIALTGVVFALTYLGGLRDRTTTVDLSPQPALTACPQAETKRDTP